MPKDMVTFQVIEGMDKGRTFRDLHLPVTLGREEGNSLRLNDERVSRFHAKVQVDADDYILTDLESTNGTRVNGNVVQIRRLRYGDRVSIGRSILLFGSVEQIADRMARIERPPSSELPAPAGDELKTVASQAFQDPSPSDLDFSVGAEAPVRQTNDAVYIGKQALPPLPQKLTPSQAARFSEILDFLHRGLVEGSEHVEMNEDGSHAKLDFADWQRILGLQMILSRYLRLVAGADSE